MTQKRHSIPLAGKMPDLKILSLRSIFIIPQKVNNRNLESRLRLFIGGLEEIRTPDPHNANVVRSQLRYKPGCKEIINR